MVWRLRAAAIFFFFGTLNSRIVTFKTWSSTYTRDQIANVDSLLNVALKRNVRFASTKRGRTEPSTLPELHVTVSRHGFVLMMQSKT